MNWSKSLAPLLCWGAFFLFSPITHSKTQKLNQLANTKQWQRLLRYQTSYISGHRSNAKGNLFFLHPQGRQKPEEEIKALYKLITSATKQKTTLKDKSPLCRFPARIKWITKELKLNIQANKLLAGCNKYQQYREKMRSTGASLVFSSYYLESPASAFGHTLLRLHRQGDEFKTDSRLLDIGINYAAQVTTDNALLYALYGMLGFFEGHYAAIPYFYKVREYSDFESRDLWSYRLNLEEKQIDRMIDHLWELGHTYFDYLYFTKNCSYELLALIEVADFNLELINQLPFYTIPGHTVKIIQQQNSLVENVSVDYSLRKRFDMAFKKLSKNDQKILLESYRRLKIPPQKKTSIDDKAALLESLMLYLDFKHPKKIMQGNNQWADWKQQIQITRSKLQTSTRPPAKKDGLTTTNKQAPHHGHGPRRVKLAYESQQQRGILGYRLAYHHFMDPKAGQPELATINFLDMQASYKGSSLTMHKMTLFEVMALNPWTQYHKPFSLKAKTGFELNQLYCQACRPLSTEVGGGVTFYHNGALSVFSFLSLQHFYHRQWDSRHQLEIAPDFNIKYDIDNALSIRLKVAQEFNIGNGDNFTRQEIEARYNMKRELSLGVQIWKHKKQNFSQLSLYQFF